MSATTSPPPAPRPSAHERRQIAVRIHRDPRAVANAYEGKAKDIVHADVDRAARELGLPPPPPPPPPRSR